MKKEDDRNWSAYIDGELSVSEVNDFEAQLSAKELEHLKNERSLEEGIGNCLKDAPCCPLSVFDCVKKEKKHFAGVAVIAAFTVAACLALVFMIPKKGTTGSKVPLSVSDLKSEAKTGSTLDEVNRYLEEKKISLEVLKFENEHHTKELIGASIEIIADEEVVTLMFTCCGRPAKVYILPRKSKAEDCMVEDCKGWKNSIQALVKKGNYHLAVASPHNSESILKYISPKA